MKRPPKSSADPVLSPALRSLVHQSVTLLGRVIEAEVGVVGYRRIERIRKKMRALGRNELSVLRETRSELEGLGVQEQRDFARAYTLMLELMNACENAYRSSRLREAPEVLPTRTPESIIYVLTAHPTEARAPANIAAFQKIQAVLSGVLARGGKGGSRIELGKDERDQLLHWLEVAWHASIVRRKKPRVQDEAEHIYSTLLRKETLSTVLAFARDVCPVYVRSWVGGDKDGHPGVDRRVFLDSLRISREGVQIYAIGRLRELQETIVTLSGDRLGRAFADTMKKTRALAEVRAGDGVRVLALRQSMRSLIEAYREEMNVLHPALTDLMYLLRTFPALLVPLEFREASDVLTEDGKAALKIRGMLKELKTVSRGGDPRWYCRGMIVSMAESMDHLRTAARFVQETFGDLRLPIVPLFEQAGALRKSPGIVREMIADPEFRAARKKFWEDHLEVMVGYSDSAKESGVLASRRQIAESMGELDAILQKADVKPIFFQGSGGSVDRGGGSIQDQIAWWPTGARENYKVTIQGEMVERSLASPEIARGQLVRIATQAGMRQKGKRPASSPELKEFAQRIAAIYAHEIEDPNFLRIVEKATPYRFLDVLKMGSRPAKRTKELKVSGLRAIPWVLCWTQTRVLFPTWWGVGRTWAASSPGEKRALKKVYAEDPLFSTYVRSLGFTLAKVELGVFRMYLEASDLPADEIARIYDRFQKEWAAAKKFMQQVTGSSKLLGWRPWLQESIRLRSPMIHPLNLLQLIALKNQDFELLRLTVTGVSSGMMTTG